VRTRTGNVRRMAKPQEPQDTEAPAVSPLPSTKQRVIDALEILIAKHDGPLADFYIALRDEYARQVSWDAARDSNPLTRRPAAG
jgi:hypothetical protein